MHIRYDTNQKTLPLEISSYLPQGYLVFTIEKVMNTLEDSRFYVLCHDFGRPPYPPLNTFRYSSIRLFTRNFLWIKN